MIKKITIIRHGQSEGNADRTYYLKMHDSEVPLTELGKSQAADMSSRLSKILRKVTFGRTKIQVCFSPYLRAIETKDILISRLNEYHSREFRLAKIREEPLIREFEYPQNKMTLEEIDSEVNDMRSKGIPNFYYRFSGGESLADVELRLVMFLNSLRSEDIDHLILVCHGEIQKVLIKRLLGLSVVEFFSLKHINNCEYTTVTLTSDGAYVIDEKNSDANDQIKSLKSLTLSTL
jgi:broad specificity phosphatase PhoE